MILKYPSDKKRNYYIWMKNKMQQLEQAKPIIEAQVEAGVLSPVHLKQLNKYISDRKEKLEEIKKE